MIEENDEEIIEGTPDTPYTNLGDRDNAAAQLNISTVSKHDRSGDVKLLGQKRIRN